MIYFTYNEYESDVLQGMENRVIDITNLVTEDNFETYLPSSNNLTLLVKVADSLGSFSNFTTFVIVS
jgi:hypothetical protein